MAMLQCLHLLLCLYLLLFFMTTVDCFPHWPTDRTSDILASMVMAQDIAGAYAMRHKTFLILAFCYVLP